MSINDMASFIKSDKDSASKYGFYDMAQKIAKKCTRNEVSNPITTPAVQSPNPNMGFLSS